MKNGLDGLAESLRERFEEIMKISDVWERVTAMNDFLGECDTEIKKHSETLTQMEREAIALGSGRVANVDRQIEIIDLMNCYKEEAKYARNALRIIVESGEYRRVYRKKVGEYLERQTDSGDQVEESEDKVVKDDLETGSVNVDRIRLVHEAVRKSLKGIAKSDLSDEDTGKGNGKGNGNGQMSV